MANSAAAHELITELNDQIAHLQEAQEDHTHTREDVDGILILDSALHPSNIPSSNSVTFPLSFPTITLTANNSKCISTHKTNLRINGDISVPVLLTPSLSRRLVSVHHVTKRAGPMIFRPKGAFMLNRNKLAATASWRNPFYKLYRTVEATAFMTKPNLPSPPQKFPHRFGPDQLVNRTPIESGHQFFLHSAEKKKLPNRFLCEP